VSPSTVDNSDEQKYNFVIQNIQPYFIPKANHNNRHMVQHVDIILVSKWKTAGSEVFSGGYADNTLKKKHTHARTHAHTHTKLQNAARAFQLWKANDAF
jgi:hypothetical protein